MTATLLYDSLATLLYDSLATLLYDSLATLLYDSVWFFYLQELSEEERAHFFSHTLKKMAALALQLPHLCSCVSIAKP